MATADTKLQAFLAQTQDVIAVKIEVARGSTPRDAGTVMYVNATHIFGTIGGGQLEHRVIMHARDMLETGSRNDQLSIPLGPAIGQCCGGNVTVSLRFMHDQDKTTTGDHDQPSVYILGAGHVGRALADQMQHLPVRCILIDGRTTQLALCDAQVETRLSALPEHDIQTAPPNSAFIILTHDHGLDFMLTAAAMARGDAAYVGMIGSASKRAQLAKWCKPASIDQVVCPIGATDNRDKRPSVIAAFVIAEVLDSLARVPEQSTKILCKDEA